RSGASAARPYAHLADAGPHHGEAPPSDPRRHPRSVLPLRGDRRHPRVDLLPVRGPRDRREAHHVRPQGRPVCVRAAGIWGRPSHPLPHRLLPVHRAVRGDRVQLLHLRGARSEVPHVRRRWLDRSRGLRDGAPRRAAPRWLRPDDVPGLRVRRRPRAPVHASDGRARHPALLPERPSVLGAVLMLIKVPLEWLREYVDIRVPIDELALKIHMSSTEVKGVERPWAAPGATTLALDGQPNRPDCLGIVGVAREVAALLATALREAALDPLTTRTPKGLDVRIEDPEACPRFAAALLRNVRIGPSPAWLQGRLVAAGMRPIDNVVDITNYVMLELGQPLHAYDHRELRGGALVARRARSGETLRTLDGVDRVLPDGTLVIADEERALGVAGIMGGESSEIRQDTTTVALE